MPSDERIIYSQIFSVTDLISAPLIATVQADFFAAERFVAYLREYGFEPPLGAPFDDFGKLRMVVFQYRTASGWMEMQVPILSLIPLPLLQVSDADFHYNIRILGLAAPLLESRDPQARAKAPWPIDIPVNPENLFASMAPLRRQGQQEAETPTLVANMDINIRMRQADLPAGIATILNVMQSAVEGRSMQRISLRPATATIGKEDHTATFTARTLGRSGEPLAGQVVRFSLTPEFPCLAPPAVTEGKEADRPSRTAVNVYTDASGQAAIKVHLAKMPAKPDNVMVTAESEFAFDSGQFGPEQARSLLQIFPPK